MGALSWPGKHSPGACATRGNSGSNGARSMRMSSNQPRILVATSMIGAACQKRTESLAAFRAEPKDVEAVLSSRAVEATGVDRLVERAHLLRVCIGVVRVHRELGEPFLDVVVFRLLRPVDRRCVADLAALPRALREQMVQCRRVGERRGRTYRRVHALLLAIRIEGGEIERDDIGASSLRAPTRP